MSNLLIEKLYIFSIQNKTAKVINFSSGKNVITSSQKDGNNMGKSVILKSIYHTLGADCKFDSKWEEKEKTYILKVNINEKVLYFYRHDRLFKIMDENNEILYETINRMELGKYLEEVFNFAVKLPNKENNKIEIAPPVYNYLLNYIAQDGMNCTNFTSFSNLSQYSNYKENVLYYHTGALDENYYKLIKDIEEVTSKKDGKSKENDVLDGMYKKINESIGTEDYNLDISSLKIEVEKYKNEYSSIIKQLSNLKNKIITLRNSKEEIELQVKELKDTLKIKHNEIKKAKEEHICPLCNNEIDDYMEISLKKYNETDDIYILNTELNMEILKIDSELIKKEEQYKQLLDKLEEYDVKMNMNGTKTNDILKIKGLISIKDNILKEIEKNIDEINSLDKILRDYKKQKKNYDDKKKQVNSKYYELMYKDKELFGLKEITNQRIENVLSTFTVSGSNIPIATIMWYMNLIKLKEIFNKKAIKFPLVIDSPQNGELDDRNKSAVLKYIFNNLIAEQQLIVAILGYDGNLNEINADNIIYLQNKEYELLNKQDYENNKDFLQKFNKIKNLGI